MQLTFPGPGSCRAVPAIGAQHEPIEWHDESVETETNPVVWDLPIIGYRVVTIEFSGRIGVVAYGTRTEGERFAPSARLCFGGTFLFGDQGGVGHSLNAESPWDQLIGLLDLRHRTVASAVADDDSHIEITFDDGSKLIAGPDPAYENWELDGPRGLNLVAMPGGGDPRISGNLG
jgi:hypothetical protein